MRYDVTFYAHVAFGMELEADNEEEAVKKVEKEFDRLVGAYCDVSDKTIVDVEEVE